VAALDWFDLYKIYEIVRANVGGQKPLEAKNWVRPSDLSAFSASANLPSISGAAARHARLSGDPKHTMSLHQARTTINHLVAAWLRTF
jgi:hypothetical protein